MSCFEIADICFEISQYCNIEYRVNVLSQVNKTFESTALGSDTLHLKFPNSRSEVKPSMYTSRNFLRCLLNWRYIGALQSLSTKVETCGPASKKMMAVLRKPYNYVSNESKEAKEKRLAKEEEENKVRLKQLDVLSKEFKKMFYATFEKMVMLKKLVFASCGWNMDVLLKSNILNEENLEVVNRIKTLEYVEFAGYGKITTKEKKLELPNLKVLVAGQELTKELLEGVFPQLEDLRVRTISVEDLSQLLSKKHTLKQIKSRLTSEAELVIPKGSPLEEMDFTIEKPVYLKILNEGIKKICLRATRKVYLGKSEWIAKVEELELVGMKIEKFPSVISPKMKSFKIKNNVHLKVMPILKSCIPNIEVLDLSHNQIDLKSQDFDGLPLKELKLKINKVVDKKFVSMLPTQLTKLNLAETFLECFPPEISKMVGLVYLNLSENDVAEIPLNSVSKLVDLKFLKLKGCLLKSIPNDIDCCKSLEYLDIAWNHLERLPDTFGGLKNLKTLVTETNPWKEMPISLFLNCLSKQDQRDGKTLKELMTYLNESIPPKLCFIFDDPEKYRTKQRTSVATNKKEHIDERRGYAYYSEDLKYPVYVTTCFSPLNLHPDIQCLMKELAIRKIYLPGMRNNSYEGCGGWGAPEEKRYRISHGGLAGCVFENVGKFMFADIIENGFMWKYSTLGVHTTNWNARGREHFFGVTTTYDPKTMMLINHGEERIGYNHEPK